MKAIGIILILISSVTAGILLEREAGRGERELSSFISFIDRLRMRLECYLATPERVALDYSDPYLEKIGFLPAIRRGEPIHSAYTSSLKHSSLPEGAHKTLDAFFSSFGKGYLSGEVRAIEGAVSSLKRSLENEAKKARSRGRALKITAPTLGMGLVILLI